MNRSATTLTASVLALGLLQPAPALVHAEDDRVAEAPVEAEANEQAQVRDDGSPSLDELLGLEADESETSAAEQAQRETDEELQRRLSDEETRYQQVLNHSRELLARHYLTNSDHTSAEISFLLGYDNPSSFSRAFHLWTGMTPEALRRKAG